MELLYIIYSWLEFDWVP